MDGFVDPYLTYPDLVVLKNLLQDIHAIEAEEPTSDYESGLDNQSPAIELLTNLTNPTSEKFQTTIFTGYDKEHINPWVNEHIVLPYARWASTIVRNPTDVVFLTHTLIYLGTSVPSALFLYYHFTWIHGFVHWAMTLFYCGAFNLMLHNHIHNNGLLKRQYAWIDQTVPFLLEPLMGHTWNSYFYHHVKHHHIENNGPDDLSSTVRHQRDELFDFLCYVGRFFFFIWAELPLYFFRKGRHNLAIGTAWSELSNYLFIYIMARLHFKATLFVLIIPLIQMRIGLMAGNWGQHALVDEFEPDSDFRSSITLIDVPSNRFCFNDGYHTSHHLNPRRHWRDHPRAFLKAKNDYCNNQALVFRNIDYLMMTYRLLKKDYLHLAGCLVPIGDQIGMSQQEIADMLRTKTRKFSEEDIRQKFRKV